MHDPDTPPREAGDGDVDPTDALLGLLEFSERWIRTRAAEMRAETERLTARVAELTAALVARGTDVSRTETERDALRAERDALRAERDALRAERDALRAERDALRGELAVERRAFTDKEAEVKRLQNSLSWRLTRPLRGALLATRAAVGRRVSAPPG